VLSRRLPEFRNARTQNGALEFECRVKHRNGEWRWARCREVVFTRTAAGDPDQVIGTVEDVTARKYAETALTRLGFAVESTTDVVAISDNEGWVEYANPAFHALCGYSVEELNAMKPWSIYATPDATMREIAAALQAKNQWSGEIEVRTKDGQMVPVLL